MAGTPGYTYLSTYARKTNTPTLHLLYLLMYYYGKGLTLPIPTKKGRRSVQARPIARALVR